MGLGLGALAVTHGVRAIEAAHAGAGGRGSRSGGGAAGGTDVAPDGGAHLVRGRGRGRNRGRVRVRGGVCGGTSLA